MTVTSVALRLRKALEAIPRETFDRVVAGAQVLELPAGEHFRCPLPNWDQRETHWVLRSGSEGLGAWHSEDRPLHADYAAAVGDPPERIVAVWLIAVSVFQKDRGCAEFAQVELSSGGKTVCVL